MKKSILLTIAVLIVLISSNYLYSQGQTFNLGAINIEYGDTLGGTNNMLFFDIVLQHTNSELTEPFEYTIGQYFLDFNPDIANGGTLSYNIVDSDLPSIFLPRNPSIAGNILRLAGNIISRPGIIMSTTSPGTKIVRMRLTTTASSFAQVPLELRWRTTELIRTKISILVNNLHTEVSENGFYYIESLENYINLLSPVNKSIVASSGINFIWNNVSSAAKYILMVANDSNMNSVLFTDTLMTDTSKFVPGFILGNKYYWRVNVHDSSGNNYYSVIKNFYTKQLSVFPPDNAINLSQTISFIWNKPGSNVSHYLLSVSKDSLLVESDIIDTLVTDTSIVLKGFEYNSEYFWKVKAVNFDSTTDFSNVKSFKTKSVRLNLAYPLNNAVNQNNIINFNWFSSEINVNRYYIKISDDSLLNNTVRLDSVDNDTNITLGPFDLDKKYYWAVSFRDSFDYVISSVIYNYRTGKPVVNLYSPQNTAYVFTINPKLIWRKPVFDARRYKLVLSRDSLQNDIVLKDSTLTDTVRNISGLDFETVYYWSVTAYDTLGNVKQSDVWSFRSPTFLYSPPYGSYYYGGAIRFEWYNVPGADSYKLEVAQDYNFTNILITFTEITDTIRNVGWVPYYSSYHWRVFAKNANGYFDTSEVWYIQRDFPVPVELSGFTSELNHNNVALIWSTTSETNNSGFDIERSSENNIWTKIGNVTGNGTSTKVNNYKFTDLNLNSGKYNYRLKQIDYNGNIEYFNLSNEVFIGVPDKFELSQNYPNPFNPDTKINYKLPANVNVSIKIFDLSGKEVMTLVNETKAAGYYSVNFSGANLSSGIYFYRISAEGNDNSFISTKKMTLIK